MSHTPFMSGWVHLCRGVECLMKVCGVRFNVHSFTLSHQCVPGCLLSLSIKEYSYLMEQHYIIRHRRPRNVSSSIFPLWKQETHHCRIKNTGQSSEVRLKENYKIFWMSNSRMQISNKIQNLFTKCFRTLPSANQLWPLIWILKTQFN